MRKRHHEEVAFGSDSFLDVVANIVGILIILIVVVGVRVSQSPPEIPPAELKVVAVEQFSSPELVPLLPLDDDFEDQPIDVSLTTELPSTDLVPPPPADFAPLPALVIPHEVVQLIETSELARQQLTAQSVALSEQLDVTRDSLQVRQQQLSEEQRELSRLATQLEVDRANANKLQLLIDEALHATALLRRNVANTEGERSQKIIKRQHRLPPVGRLVTDEEIHFRLSENRVSHVPILELATLTKREIERRREVIVKRSVYRGTCGPLEGYEMTYTIERQPMTLLDEAQLGRAMIRWGMTSWIAQPTPALVTENFTEAIQRNSRFRNALLRNSQATITFWVYPDSFEIHGELKQYLQDSGFWVASRPLPTGVPIAGSPNGSRSVAQ